MGLVKMFEHVWRHVLMITQIHLCPARMCRRSSIHQTFWILLIDPGKWIWNLKIPPKGKRETATNQQLLGSILVFGGVLPEVSWSVRISVPLIWIFFIQAVCPMKISHEDDLQSLFHCFMSLGERGINQITIWRERLFPRAPLFLDVWLLVFGKIISMNSKFKMLNLKWHFAKGISLQRRGFC